jgi:diacylglycerol kinase (ATP)
MRVAVIVNPRAGVSGRAGAAGRRVALAEQVLDGEGVEGEVRLTAGPGHAGLLAREALGRGATLVVAWGGDGTVLEVGTALVFRDAALGIVPAGSGNGLARTLGVPRDPAAALRAALQGAERSIDAGELGGRLFFNAAGIGLDARIAERFNARASARRGLWPYAWLTAAELATGRAVPYTIRADGERLVRRALMVVWANGPEYGGGARIAPHARVDDGAIDLVIVDDRSIPGRFWTLRRLFTGTLDRAPGVLVRPVRQLEVAAAEPVLFHVDGEPAQGAATLAGRVYAGALRVRAPAAPLPP